MASIESAEAARTPRAKAFEILRVAVETILQFIGILAAITIVVAGGIWSSRYLVSNGSPLSVKYYGPWTNWPGAASPDSDPYTRAHFLTSGRIELPAESSGVFEARTDNEGASLHSSCDYILEGPSPGGRWWSLAVYDSSGMMISNEADRYAFTSDTVAPNPDGSYFITLGREARPGNWLPTSRAGRLVVVFTVLDPATGLSQAQRAERYLLLPQIKREGCS